jgi:8-oxo-dGTP pyrophosphatase MutT (NUDIX family)/DNA-binding XRE family transcriptional regulator
MRTMGNRIRAIREKRDQLIPGEYTQAALARRLGVSANTVRSWELDRARPRKAAAKRLAKVLGVKVEDLGLDVMPLAARRDQTNLVRPAEELESSTTDARPVIAAAIIPNPEGWRHEVLMTERRFATERVWSWPAGHVHQGEQPVDTVLRELNEELVVQDARVVRHLGDVDTHTDVSRYWGHQYRNGYRMLHYQVAIASPTVEVIDHEELVRAEWLSLNQVGKAVTSLPPELAEAALKFVRQVTIEPADVEADDVELKAEVQERRH